MKILMLVVIACLCLDAEACIFNENEAGKYTLVPGAKKMRMNGVQYFCDRDGDCRTFKQWKKICDTYYSEDIRPRDPAMSGVKNNFNSAQVTIK